VIHRRSDKLFAGASHNRGGKHIVGDTVCKLAYHVCACRRNQHDVSRLCESDVLNAILKIAVESVDKALVLRERFKRYRIYKLRSVFRHQNVNVRVKLCKLPCAVSHFVCRDAARHRYENGFPFEHNFSSVNYIYSSLSNIYYTTLF
jgi:hypothetical protein